MVIKRYCQEKNVLNNMLPLCNIGVLVCAYNISGSIQKNSEQ